ncbi:Esterase TesA precursor [Gimesia panareensis]|uniref:Esterase TesA n=1 Tax=Gimesia panareensis TaxID=2527978 RepID=A0A518FIT1_9PLAN|nr:GDSL-type esterase/lipase family protein [Gimesia panareensis]QDV16254.1 Esterase TesA precursor [Gimesia panareensis]
MNPIVYHIASGQSFFTGCTLIILAAMLSLNDKQWTRRMMGFSFLLGVIAVVVSSTPLPWWSYSVLGTVILIWLVAQLRKQRQRGFTYAVIVVWLAAVGMELPCHRLPHVEPVSERSMTVIGDSVTAGLGDPQTKTWPQLLKQKYRVVVQDLSRVGATVSSARKQVVATRIESPLVLLEIGGNDILGSTTPAQFEADLNALLKVLAAPGRQLVMLELPLPPFYNRFGLIQRELARKYGAKLIPKRVFLSVLAGGGATLDSIHLSQAGQQQMADVVWEVVGPAYGSD